MNSIINIRASSLSELFDCPARWAAKHIEGMKLPSSSKALLGTAVHASTALYDQSVLDNSDITIEEAKAAAVDVIHNIEEEIMWEDTTAIETEHIALSLHERYCNIIAPNIEYAAVELECETFVIEDLGLSLSGTTDRLYIDSYGKYGIADIKTGKSSVNSNNEAVTKNHAYQLGMYEILAEHGSGLEMEAPAKIIGLQTNKKPEFQKVGIGHIENPKNVLLGEENNPGVLEIASKLIHSGNFYGNPNSYLCHEKYCPRYKVCKFRK